MTDCIDNPEDFYCESCQVSCVCMCECVASTVCSNCDTEDFCATCETTCICTCECWEVVDNAGVITIEFVDAPEDETDTSW